MKNSIILFLILFSSFQCFAQALTIATATLVNTQDVTFPGVVVNSFDVDMNDGCLESSNRVWFKLTPTANGTLTLSYTGAISGATGILYSAANLSATLPTELTLVTCGSNSLSVTSGQDYYLAVYNGATIPPNSPIDIRIQSDVPLPVELTSFTANLNGNGVLLQWETETEVNNYGFEVERNVSYSDQNDNIWEKISFLPGHGNSNSPKYYEFMDEINDFDFNSNVISISYRLKQIDLDGKFEYSKSNVEISADLLSSIKNSTLSKEYKLNQNYPNPFNPTTVINFSIPVDSFVELNVFDVLGNKIKTLISDNRPSGNYSVEFDTSLNGKTIPSGIYYYRLKSGNFTQTKKMIILK